MTTDASQPTELQLRARQAGDVLLAAGATAPPADIRSVWNAFAKVETVPSRKHPAYDAFKARTAANDAIDRMLKMGEGAKLVRDVRKLRKGAVRVTVDFRDVDDLPQNTTEIKEDDEGSKNNFFTPTDPGRKRYTLYIVWQPDKAPNDMPLLDANRYALGLSELADSVFHELLHVWYTHVYPNDHLGHGGGYNDRFFRQRLRDFKDELLVLDKTLKRRPPLRPRP
jgi:hypothetical protein